MPAGHPWTCLESPGQPLPPAPRAQSPFLLGAGSAAPASPRPLRLAARGCLPSVLRAQQQLAELN